jgi:hypothetical protein
MTATERFSTSVELGWQRPHPGRPHYGCRHGVLMPCPISIVGTAAGPARSAPPGPWPDADAALVVLS